MHRKLSWSIKDISLDFLPYLCNEMELYLAFNSRRSSYLSGKYPVISSTSKW